MNNIPTAEEFITSWKNNSSWIEPSQLPNLLIEFAKLHVQEALKTASENVKVEIQISDGLFETNVKKIIKKDSIINAYPLNKIK